MIPHHLQVMRIFWKTWTKIILFFQMMATMASNTNDLFNSHEMEEGGGQSMDMTIGA
jgi:hypothetical protein